MKHLIKYKQFYGFIISFLLYLIIFLNSKNIFVALIPIDKIHVSFINSLADININNFQYVMSASLFFLLLLSLPLLLMIKILIPKKSKKISFYKSDGFFLYVTTITVISSFVAAMLTLSKENFEFFSTILSTMLIFAGFLKYFFMDYAKTLQRNPKKIKNKKRIRRSK